MAEYLTHLNLNKNELQNAVIQNLATDPSSPKAGQFWFNTAVDLFKFYDGTNVKTFQTVEDLSTVLADYQAKITASGILKGTGSAVTSAIAGTDYGYPTLTGASNPTTSTEGAIGQHYLNTSTGVEYVCKTITPGVDPDPTTYTWVPVTTDISAKQDTITATGILKGQGSGVIASAVAGTDYAAVPLTGTSAPTTSTEGLVGQTYTDTSAGMQYVCTEIDDSDTPIVYTWKPVVTATASKALVSDANGKVVASSVTATELGYLSGVTSNIQDQLDDIPKLNYLNGVECTVNDGATQSDINAAATTAITTEYSSPNKYDAVNVLIKFTPSDEIKNGLYMYNGTTWAFQYYTTTGIQLASGTTAGLIQEASSNSDLTLAGGVATVNVATALRTSRTITVEGDYTDGTAQTDGISATGASFDGSGNATIQISGIKPQMLSAAVPVSKGGTGKTSITNGNVLVGNSSGGFDEKGIDSSVTDDSSNLITSGAVATALSTVGTVKKYTEMNSILTPSSGVCTWTVNHDLGSTAVLVQVFDLTTNAQVVTDVVVTDQNNVSIKINSADSIPEGSYSVVVVG